MWAASARRISGRRIWTGWRQKECASPIWHANSPVCSPSRASVLTGKYPQHAGIPEILFSRPTFDVPGLKAGERTLASELRKLGYRTAAVGKWHLGSAPESRPRAQGFDEFFGFYSGWIDYYSHRYYTLGGQPVFHDLWRNDEEVWEEPAYQTEMLAREANAFLSRQRRHSVLPVSGVRRAALPDDGAEAFFRRLPAIDGPRPADACGRGGGAR